MENFTPNGNGQNLNPQYKNVGNEKAPIKSNPPQNQMSRNGINGNPPNRPNQFYGNNVNPVNRQGSVYGNGGNPSNFAGNTNVGGRIFQSPNSNNASNNQMSSFGQGASSLGQGMTRNIGQQNAGLHNQQPRPMPQAKNIEEKKVGGGSFGMTGGLAGGSGKKGFSKKLKIIVASVISALVVAMSVMAGVFLIPNGNTKHLC